MEPLVTKYLSSADEAVVVGGATIFSAFLPHSAVLDFSIVNGVTGVQKFDVWNDGSFDLVDQNSLDGFERASFAYKQMVDYFNSLARLSRINVVSLALGTRLEIFKNSRSYESLSLGPSESMFGSPAAENLLPSLAPPEPCHEIFCPNASPQTSIRRINASVCGLISLGGEVNEPCISMRMPSSLELNSRTRPSSCFSTCCC